MQNNLVYQNIVRTFASLKQGSRLVVNGLIRYFVGYKPNQYIRNFQQVRLHRLDFLFIHGSAFSCFQQKDIGFKQCSPVEVSRSYIKLLLYTNICLIR